MGGITADELWVINSHISFSNSLFFFLLLFSSPFRGRNVYTQFSSHQLLSSSSGVISTHDADGSVCTSIMAVLHCA